MAQGRDEIESRGRIHVVGEHDGPRSTLGPRGQEGNRLSRPRGPRGRRADRRDRARESSIGHAGKEGGRCARANARRIAICTGRGSTGLVS